MRARRLDELTAREQEVLQLIRAGLTNEEIAERLSISLDGAKYHVSQILSKLGAASREEAVAVARGARDPRARWAAWPLWAKVAGGAGLAAVVAGISVLVWGVLAPTGSGEEERAGTSALPTRTPVPWTDSTPGPTPSPSPLPTPNPEDLAIRPCRAADLDAARTGGNGAGGWIFWYLGFSNRSGTECRLQGVPGVRLVDADGLTVSTAQEDPCLEFRGCAPGMPVLLAANGAPPQGEESRGQASIALLFWGRRDWTPCAPRATALGIELPEEGGHLTVPLAAVDGCIKPSVSQFISTEPRPTPTPPPQPLAASLIVPPTATAGERLEFQVELTNVSRVSFSFAEPCPDYMVTFEPQNKTIAWHSLNCLPAGAIEPGDSVWFDMILDLPSIPAGSYTLGWVLELHQSPLEATASLTVVGPLDQRLPTP